MSPDRLARNNGCYPLARRSGTGAGAVRAYDRCMAKVAYICARCRLRIDPDEDAVILDREKSAGWVDGVELTQPDRKAVHAGHEDVLVARGYRETARGRLDDIVP
jgi:hypothetical protein